MPVGVFNQADNVGGTGSPYNSDTGLGKVNAYHGTNGAYESGLASKGNGGNGSGNDDNGDVTVINTAVAFNPTFAADNVWNGEGAIGLYGRSRGLGKFSIGVMGQSTSGCGIYGLATDEIPGLGAHGIGVVGRSVAGNATEYPLSVEQLMANGQGMGVFAQAANGPGIRGHSGPLPANIPTPPLPAATAQPGGWFSSGQLYPNLSVLGNLQQEVTLGTPQPQLRLTPFLGTAATGNNVKPASPMIGNFFLEVGVQGDETPATLWICTRYSGPNNPVWQPVLLGAPV